MKAFTDIEQSKKLAEILPIESADMHYVRKVCDFRGRPVAGKWSEPKYGNINSNYANYIVQNFTQYEKLSCWSLAALLEVLPRYIEIDGYISFLDIYKTKNLGWVIEYSNQQEDFVEFSFDSQELIDACVEMIIKLKEKGIL